LYAEALQLKEVNPKVLYYTLVVSFLVLMVVVLTTELNVNLIDNWVKRSMFYIGALLVASWMGIMINRSEKSTSKIGTKHVWSIQQFIIFSFAATLTIWVVFTPVFGLEISMLVTGLILLWVYYWSRFLK
jgi:hypothetical protein